MKDNKGFWNSCAGIYDKIISADKNTYAHILSRMKRKLNRNMAVLELSGFKVFHKWKPREYLDFLRTNGFIVTVGKVYGRQALTYAEAKVKGERI